MQEHKFNLIQPPQETLMSARWQIGSSQLQAEPVHVHKPALEVLPTQNEGKRQVLWTEYDCTVEEHTTRRLWFEDKKEISCHQPCCKPPAARSCPRAMMLHPLN